jgi:hypothetical protein
MIIALNVNKRWFNSFNLKVVPNFAETSSFLLVIAGGVLIGVGWSVTDR